MTRVLPFLIVAAALLTGCAPDDLTGFDFQALQPPAPPPEATGDAVVGTTTDGGLTVEMTAARGGPHVGYVRLGISVRDGASVLSEARIALSATPDDGPAAGVALPVENPTTSAEGVFQGGAFLLAPDRAARHFTIRATVEAAGKTAHVAFPVEARDDLWMQAQGGVLVSWVSPLRPVVGDNTFEVAAYRWNGQAFTPLTGATPTLYPYMDMGGGDGHSTPHRDLPASTPGRYRWSVEFIMSGGWDMTVTLAPPSGAAVAALFEDYTVYDR